MAFQEKNINKVYVINQVSNLNEYDWKNSLIHLKTWLQAT